MGTQDSAFLPMAYFNGAFVPLEEAKVSVTTHALQYGTGVFGGMRGYLDADGKTINIFRMHDHFRRLMQSAAMLKIQLPFDMDGLCNLAMELTRRNEPTGNVYYRPFAYKSGESLVPKLTGVPDGFVLYMLPLNEFYAATDGLSVMVSSWKRISDNAIPSRGKVSGSYINSSIAKDEALVYGFDEAIMLNERNKVSEGSASNLFLVRNNTLITSPVTADILEGITRRSIMQIARDLGMALEEREIDRTELYLADELFFAGTGVQITWIGQVDKRTVGAGREGLMTAQLRERFHAIVQGRVPEYASWLTPVSLSAPVGT